MKILLDTIFGKRNFKNEIAWCYASGGVSKKYFGKKHDIIFFYSKSDSYKFNAQYRPYSEGTIQRGLTNYKKQMNPEYVLRDEGAVMNDWWDDITPLLSPTQKERLGYPTQKPITLLERIINASSDEGDVVLDPFCGCGTTITASQLLKRKWIGIDVTHLAINLIKLRLKDMFGLQPKIDYQVIGEPEDLTGATELASQNRYQFQWWAGSLINARPYQDKKKGSDTGIDGFIYFQDEKDKVQKVIVQVKSGHVSVKDIRDLGHVIDREGSEIGIFVTLESPTSHMIKEAVQKGFYKSPLGKQYPKIQIKTIEELLKDNRLDIPSSHISHKQAQPSDKSEQFKLDV